MLFTVTRRPHVFTLQFGLPFVTPLNPRALPLGRLTKRTPTHIPVPLPNPAVEPLAVSFGFSIPSSVMYIK